MRKLFVILFAFSSSTIWAQPNALTGAQVSKLVADQNLLTSNRHNLFFYKAQRSVDEGNYKVQYFVLKKDSTGMNVNSQIFVTDDGRYYLSTENKEKSDEAHRIYANETIKINFVDNRFQTVVQGIANDTAWLFKAVEGKINLYTCYPPPSELIDLHLTAFQIGDGVIEPLDADKLKLAVQNNPKALKALEKKSYLKAVNIFNRE